MFTFEYQPKTREYYWKSENPFLGSKEKRLKVKAAFLKVCSDCPLFNSCDSKLNFTNDNFLVVRGENIAEKNCRINTIVHADEIKDTYYMNRVFPMLLKEFFEKTGEQLSPDYISKNLEAKGIKL